MERRVWQWQYTRTATKVVVLPAIRLCSSKCFYSVLSPHYCCSFAQPSSTAQQVLSQPLSSSLVDPNRTFSRCFSSSCTYFCRKLCGDEGVWRRRINSAQTRPNRGDGNVNVTIGGSMEGVVGPHGLERQTSDYDRRLH